jgi:GMP synthase (glutamine-hydrolysing)
MITVINFGSSKTPQILSVVRELGFEAQEKNWKDFSATDYDRMVQELPHVDGNADDGKNHKDKIIFSGSPTFLTEVDHAPYTERYSCIRQGKIPVLGICFGHQVMGIVHGAQIFRGEEIRTDNEIHVVKEDQLFAGLSPGTVMKEDHTEGISLPAGFIHLAYSKSYAIEAMRHPTLPLWGIQFHPEVSGENGKILIRNFLNQ